MPKVVVVSDDYPSESDPFASKSSDSNKIKIYYTSSARSDKDSENSSDIISTYLSPFGLV